MLIVKLFRIIPAPVDDQEPVPLKTIVVVPETVAEVDEFKLLPTFNVFPVSVIALVPPKVIVPDADKSLLSVKV